MRFPPRKTSCPRLLAQRRRVQNLVPRTTLDLPNRWREFAGPAELRGLGREARCRGFLRPDSTSRGKRGASRRLVFSSTRQRREFSTRSPGSSRTSSVGEVHQVAGDRSRRASEPALRVRGALPSDLGSDYRAAGDRFFELETSRRESGEGCLRGRGSIFRVRGSVFRERDRFLARAGSWPVVSSTAAGLGQRQRE